MTPASRALVGVLDLLDAAGIPASRAAADFSAELGTIGVLVGLPARTSATLGAVTFEVPVLVIAGDPVNTPDAVDRLYAEADEIAHELRVLQYRHTTWGGRSGSEPLTAIEIIATVTVSNEEE